MSTRRVSIVVPVTGDAMDEHETVASVQAQGYPAVEVLVEKRDRLRDALEAGFARAAGEVLAFLRPGERLLGGALREAVSALDSAGAVMGGCAVVVAGAGQEVVVELPAEYRDLFDHLAVWRSRWDRSARPALFWSRQRHADIARFIDAPAYAVDYDVVCRLGRKGIRRVDGLWSVRPMPEREETEATQLLDLIGVSRTHWGSWMSPLRWRCELSYLAYARHRHDRARHHAREAEAAAERGDRMGARIQRLETALYSPTMARERFGVAYRRLLDKKSR